MKIVVVGGVAGGASAAARARRLGETGEIVVFERGEHPSFANCGLPYYVGGKIESRNKLLVAPVEMLRHRHRLDVRTRCEVLAIHREAKQVRVRELETGNEYDETYDKLILSPGASPIRPPIPGIESSRVMTLRDLNDADRMHSAATSNANRAVIVGGGFIGVEVAENLVHRGIDVTLVELGDQILAPWDPEMIVPIHQQMEQRGIHVRLKDAANSFEETADGLTVGLQSGESIDADFAVLCIGVKPENNLAADAGLACGQRGGIQVNQHMQTDDPDIYAVGDAVEVSCFISGTAIQIPLAGPANRQGRIAADHIFGRDSSYRGTQGTAIVGVFEKTAAMTGLSEKVLRRLERSYEKVYLHPSDHAGYYPGATQMSMKLLFNPEDGKILGAQAVGVSGVDKRIDVLATAIQAGMTVEDLEEAELCYAPQYGHAKDPVNMAGFIASGVFRGDHPVVHSDALSGEDDRFILDVRTTGEFEQGHLPGAVNIPIESLREHLDELPNDKTIVTYCKVGQRGYLATRVLTQNGFQSSNLSGGYLAWCAYQAAREM